MKRLSMTFLGLIAGALLLLGANTISIASEGTTSKADGVQVTASTTDQRLAYRMHYRPYCYKVKRCVRVNRFGNCKRWNWVTVCPGWRI